MESFVSKTVSIQSHQAVFANNRFLLLNFLVHNENKWNKLELNDFSKEREII
jgi:hypothetical protein